MDVHNEVIKMIEEFHCKECAGKAKAKGEECSTCDGEGNPKQKPAKTNLFKFKKSEVKENGK